MVAADRKAEIRRKSAEVFAAQGYDRASIRDVAKAARLSLAGLYYYYRGKEEILYDIQREAFETLLGSHADALAGVKKPVDKLGRIIEAHLAFFAGHIAEMKVMSRESESLTGEFAERINDLKRRYVRLVRGILEEMGKARALKPIPPSVAVFILFGMMNWMYTWYDAQRDGSASDIAAQVREIFLGGIVA